MENKNQVLTSSRLSLFRRIFINSDRRRSSIETCASRLRAGLECHDLLFSKKSNPSFLTQVHPFRHWYLADEELKLLTHGFLWKSHRNINQYEYEFLPFRSVFSRRTWFTFQYVFDPNNVTVIHCIL